MFMGKKVKVFRRGQAEERFLELEKSHDKKDQSILRSVYRVIGLLKENPQFGNPIRKELIPDIYKKANIHNLYRIELANYWRLIYTLKGTETIIFVFVLGIMNHKEYNKLFGYR